MNKFFTKIASLSVGLALAIGVGVAIGNNTSVGALAVSDGDVFSRISSVSDLADGDLIIFVNQGGTYACGTTQNTNNRTPVSITTSSNSYTYDSDDSVQVFTVKKSGDNFGFHTGSGYIYSASSSKNYLKTNTTAVSTAPSGTSAWNLTVSSNVFTCKNASNKSYYLAFNGTSYFSQYSSGQSKPYIYKKAFKITYAANGGSGTMSPSSGFNPAVASCTFTAPTGHEFNHWNTSATDNGDTYAVGATPKKDLNLYAIWSKASYEVSGTITNGSLSSTANVEYNDPLDITLNPSTGYNLPNNLDTITMGGSPVAGAYTSSNGKIYIEHVTGDIYIEATCPSSSAKLCNIVYSLHSSCTTDGPATMYSTETITINVTPLEHYTLTNSTVDVTGSLNDWSYLNGVITIDKPTADIIISVTCPQKSHPSIGTSLTKVSAKEGNPTNVWEDETASLYFEADEGYALPDSISISGTTAYIWNKSLGRLDVTGQKSNISVSITGEEKTLISISISPTSGEHKLGDIFVAPTVTANFNTGPEIITNYEIETSCLDMDDLMFVNEGDDQSIVFNYSYGGGEPVSATYTADVSERVPTTGGWMEVTETRTDFSGEYVILSEDYIMGDSISSDRVTNNGTPTITDGKLTTTVTNAMKWTISKSGSVYTIQNVGNSKFLSSTGANSKAALLEEAGDKSTWTISYSSGFTITNKYNSDNDKNGVLRNNSSYGWAAYSSSTGKAPRLFEYVPPVENVLVKITAEIKAGRRFQGDVLTASDFVVTAHYANGDSSTVSSDITITGGTLELVGENDVTVSYGGKKDVVEVTALAPATVTSVDLVVPGNYKKDYVQGDDPLSWNLTGLTVHCVWSNPDLNEDLILSDLVSAGQASISPSIPTVGTESFTVSYSYYGTSISIGTATVTGIEVVDDPVDSISWTGTKTGEFNVYDSDTLTAAEASNWVVKRTYEIKSDVVIPYGEYDILINDEKVTLPYQYKVGDTKITISDPVSGKVNNRTLTVTADEIVSIEATCDKSFKVGESIAKSDITLKATYKNPNREKETINDFTFTEYQFTYSDATSGGDATEKTFTINYSDKSCTLTVNASREAYVAPSTEDVDLDISIFNGIGGSNTDLRDGTVTDNSTGITYKYHKAYWYGSKSSLSFSKDGQPSGYDVEGTLENTTPFDKPITDVNLVDSGDNEWYLFLSEDGGEEGTWINWNERDESTNYYYFRIDYSDCDISKYINISSITFTFKGDETPTTLANYVMYEDTNNQCETKFEVAESIFEILSDEEKSTFMTSNDYVIRTARERLIDWAKHHGKSIVASDDTYVIRAFKSPLMVFDSKTTSVSIVVILSSLVAVGAFAGYFYYKKKKED